VEHHLVSSMLATLPLLFSEPRIQTHSYQTKAGVGRFRALPGYLDWGMETDQDSLSHKFFNHLDGEYEFFQNHLAAELIECPELELICRNILDHSYKFCQQLMATLGTTYHTMVKSFNNPDDTWDLACFALSEVFLKEFKRPLANLTVRDFRDVDKTLLNAIFVSLQIHKVVQSFLSKGVNEHSALHSAKINFVIQKGLGKNGALVSQKKSGADDDVVSKLQDEVSSLKRQYEGHEKQWRKKIASIESMATACCAKLNLPTK